MQNIFLQAHLYYDEVLTFRSLHRQYRPPLGISVTTKHQEQKANDTEKYDFMQCICCTEVNLCTDDCRRSHQIQSHVCVRSSSDMLRQTKTHPGFTCSGSNSAGTTGNGASSWVYAFTKPSHHLTPNKNRVLTSECIHKTCWSTRRMLITWIVNKATLYLGWSRTGSLCDWFSISLAG